MKSWHAIILFSCLSGCYDRSVPPAPVFRTDGTLIPLSSQQSQEDFPKKVRVAPGDNLYAIARRHTSSLRCLIEVNHLRPPFALQAGQILTLVPPHTYVVKKGDTLYQLARFYGFNVQEVAKQNKIKPSEHLKAGKILYFPSICTTIDPVPPKPAPKAIQKIQQTYTPPPATGGNFDWPARGEVLSSFGDQGHGMVNDGINIAGTEGMPFKAAENGRVIYVGDDLKGYGNLLLLKHDKGLTTAYAHGQKIMVKKGDIVKKGQVVGLLGQTGNVPRPQLHFEVRQGRIPLDPLKFLAAL